MTKQEGIQLFNSMLPVFLGTSTYERFRTRGYLTRWFCRWTGSTRAATTGNWRRTVSFGFLQGSIADVKAAMAEVDEDWPQYFTEGQRIYCAYVDGKIVSFCTVTNLGVHDLNGRKVKVG